MGDPRSGGTVRHEKGHAALLGAADWLCLAAAPVFAIMALLTAFPGGGVPLCSGAHRLWPMDDMVAMYALMSAFHAPPWLRLISGRCDIARRS